MSIQKEILTRALKRLKLSNARISIRALALKVGVSHVFLSKIISGKVLLPLKLVTKLSESFQLDEYDSEELRKYIIEKKIGSSVAVKFGVSRKSMEGYVDLPERKYNLFSNWWSFAVLELLTCSLPIKMTRSTVRTLLKVPKAELDVFLDEVIKLGIVSEDKDLLSKTATKLRIPTMGPNPSSRQLYKQIAQKTVHTLGRTSKADFDKRLVMGFSCAANPKNIPLVKAKLAEAVRECAELLAEGECTDVFWIQGQMFSLLSENDG